jgi:hypothetical protein
LVLVSLGVICVLCACSSALAQSAAPPAWRVDGGVGVLWIGRQALGDTAATETTASGGKAALFTSSSELAAAAGMDGRVGVRLTRSLVAEAEVSYLKPQLRIAISGDSEGAAPVTATETVQQFTLGGGVRWYLPGRVWSPRFAPFATAGGGYLRQLHEQATLVDTGRYYQVGGGVSALIARGGRFHTKGFGARFDARAVIRSKGVAFDGGSKTSPAAGVAIFVRF